MELCPFRSDLSSLTPGTGGVPTRVDELAGEHTTLQGSTLTVQRSGQHFTVDGMANVVCGGIHADNATIHVIDEVLHP